MEYLQLEKFQFNAAQFVDTQLYDKLNRKEIKHILCNDFYIYSTRLFFATQKPKINAIQKNHDFGNFEALPENPKVETILLRDMKIAYGLNIEVDFLAKFVNLKVLVVELNDLRGSDRSSFPKQISDITRSVSSLKHLECIELT